MKKLILILALNFLFAACSPSRSVGPIHPVNNNNSEGGVDVGNLASAVVPQTHAQITYPGSWTVRTVAASLTLSNGRGSVIDARRSDITGLASPTAIGLQQYLKEKFPSRDYKIININGLQGVRADLINTKMRLQSDIYLVSELTDFLHIQSDLNAADDGITAGEKIIRTVRVEYKGLPYPNPQPKTVTLYAYSLPDKKQSMRAAYSFLDDCYSYVDNNCQGASILFGNGGRTGVTVGNAGYDHGRIIELGPESEVPFDMVRVEGKYLVSPLSKIPISDIYTAFTPAHPQQEQDSIDLKEGYVYLVRTIRWPEEDLITKFKVQKLQPDQSAEITYEKLVYVDKKQLKKQVDELNKYTLEYEKPLSSGDVTLYNRSVWNNYFYASFNFKYSTSGNMYITNNNWDLLFGRDGHGDASFSVPYSGGSLGQVLDIGEKSLDQITTADFPDPNTFIPHRDPKVIASHSYVIYHITDEGQITYGAVRVVELGPKNAWVHLKFRRIAIEPVRHFQRWIPLQVFPGVQKVTLEISSNNETSVFLPFTNKREDQGPNYSNESINFNPDGSGGDTLSVDSRPFGKERGFYKLNRVPFESITETEVISFRGLFTDRINIQKGDVIAVLLENYYDDTIMAMRVDDLISGKSVSLSIRYLYRAKTVYSDDPN